MCLTLTVTYATFICSAHLRFLCCYLAAARGGPLNVIGNLPYYVTSQVLFNLADNYKCMNSVVITCQWEVYYNDLSM